MKSIGKGGRTTLLAVAIVAILSAIAVLFVAEATLSIGFFAAAPTSVSAAHQNAIFNAFGNSSVAVGGKNVAVANPLVSGAPVGNFIVTSAAYITNATNASYVLGSAVGGKATMVLNGSVLNGNVYTADIQFVVNGSTSFTLPIQNVWNGSTSLDTLFQIRSLELVGFGTQSGVTVTPTVNAQPSLSGVTNYNFGVIGKGTYVLEIAVSPTQTHSIGNAATQLALFNLGGASGAPALTGGASGQPVLENFQLIWKN